MAEILTEKGICDACGSRVREGSAFCYSCGDSVVVEPEPPPILKPNTGTLEGTRNGGYKTIAFSEPEPPPVPVPVSDPIAPASNKPSVRRTSVDLATNVTKRRAAKPDKRKAAELEWVQHEPSAARFLITTFLLAGIAAGLVAAAFYLK